MIQLSSEQRESIQRVVKDTGLCVEEIEQIMLGQLSPIYVLQMILHIQKISWLKGQQATIELHNKIELTRAE